MAAIATRLHPKHLGVATGGRGLVLLFRPLMVDLLEAAGLSHDDAASYLPRSDCLRMARGYAGWTMATKTPVQIPCLPLRRVRLDHGQMGGPLRRVPGVGNRGGDRAGRGAHHGRRHGLPAGPPDRRR